MYILHVDAILFNKREYIMMRFSVALSSHMTFTPRPAHGRRLNTALCFSHAILSWFYDLLAK